MCISEAWLHGCDSSVLAVAYSQFGVWVAVLHGHSHMNFSRRGDRCDVHDDIDADADVKTSPFMMVQIIGSFHLPHAKDSLDLYAEACDEVLTTHRQISRMACRHVNRVHAIPVRYIECSTILSVDANAEMLEFGTTLRADDAGMVVTRDMPMFGFALSAPVQGTCDRIERCGHFVRVLNALDLCAHSSFWPGHTQRQFSSGRKRVIDYVCCSRPSFGSTIVQRFPW